jgi:hypothetical protein
MSKLLVSYDSLWNAGFTSTGSDSGVVSPLEHGVTNVIEEL